MSDNQNDNHPEPFGYFRCNSFAWENCAEDDEGAIPLYEHPPRRDHFVGVSEMVEPDHIPDTEKMIRPSAHELQDQEIGINQPFTELLNPSS